MFAFGMWNMGLFYTFRFGLTVRVGVWWMGGDGGAELWVEREE